MTNLTQYQNDIYIDEITKETFTSMRGAARICNVSPATIHANLGKYSDHQIAVKTSEVLTPAGLRSVRVVDEVTLMKLIAKYNPSLLPQLAQAGLRAYLYSLAGYQLNATPKKQEPSSELDLIICLAQEMKKMQADIADVQKDVAMLMPDNQYMSLVRFVKEYKVKIEGSWSAVGKKLTKMSKEQGYDVNSVPDPKYGKVNTYDVDLMRLYFVDQLSKDV